MNRAAVFLCGCMLLGCSLHAHGVQTDTPKTGDNLMQTKLTQVTMTDTGEVLNNPGMGWVLYYYDQHMARYGSQLSPSDTVDDFPGVSVIYMAIPWAFLEPQEGKYDWSVIDTPAQRWIAKGKKIALRFPCCEPFYEYATPRWVQKAGATFYPFQTTERTKKWVKQLLNSNIPETCYAPNYGDTVFLQKHANFLAAAAKRYDGNPNVAYIDVGSLGTWGEGHTSMSCQRQYGEEVRLKHLQMYKTAFSITLLVAGDDFLRVEHGKDNPTLIKRAVELGMALRDDSVLVDNMNRLAESEVMARSFWPTVPVILEPAHYGQATNWWDTWRDGSPYVESIERYHASYAGAHWWPREFLEKNRDLIDRVNRRIGYRIQLTQASWPEQVAIGTPWTFTTIWQNAGVAPCYAGGYPALTLKDKNGGIVAVQMVEDFNINSLPATGHLMKVKSLPHQATLTLSPTLRIPPGDYSLFISVGDADGTPRFALPLEGHDGQRRYRLGAVTIVAP